ncbi:MAG: cobalt-precorrin-5B (C(1))-methyltransferase [Hyphomicrobiales bacterium]|nr:cobalt-precorrin-5B (C(1))-methyltransferase [Hyphomicrobiales bacterium]
MDTRDHTKINNERRPSQPLRKGWTTGACATAATKAALQALLSGEFPDAVTITLPKGQTPSFALAFEDSTCDYAIAGIVKDAGDDPDVTHLAMIQAKVERGEAGSGIIILAGEGVGTVTKPGLPVEVGAPAINPVPRAMITDVIENLCKAHNIAADITVTVSVPQGEALAKNTWNPRLGIIGGLSILGTTGIVHPFSCSAWIHSIHRGIDVSRATGITHVLGATGSTSQAAAEKLYDFSQTAILDMGDFVGGLLKYLRANPVPKVTLAGGFAKFTKLAQGAMDLHSGRSQVDMDWLGAAAKSLGANPPLVERIQNSNTAMQALDFATSMDIDLPNFVAIHARKQALRILRDAQISVEVIIVSRSAKILARHE